MRKIKYFLGLLIILVAVTRSADMADYCSVPPFIGGAVEPNILFVVDASGSMRWCAYNPRLNGKGCGNYTSGWAGKYRGDEEGYFIPDHVYILNPTLGYWVETTATPANCPKTMYDLDLTQPYRGSCLNFLLMTRIDLVRWAITGGRPASCATSSSCEAENPPSSCFNVNRCDPELYGQPGANLSCDNDGCILSIQNPYIPEWWGGNWIYVRYVKVPWNRIYDALVFRFKRLTTKPRMGALFYSGHGVRDHKVYIGDFTSSNALETDFPYRNLITAINAVYPENSTPTAPALWDAYNYFAQNDPKYGGFSPQSGAGDKWKNPIYQCTDLNNDGLCQASELNLVPCAKNFVILLTDGQWNHGGDPGSVTLTCTIDTGFEQASADPVVPAYWLHYRGFVNNPACTNEGFCDTLRIDALYGIGLWLGGTGELSLQHVAMYGSFDLSGNQWPGGMSGYPSVDSCSIDDCTDYVDGSADSNDKGSPCTPLPSSSPDWDKDGDGLPDTFYAARNATEIKTAIQSAILDILRRASSGSTVATLASRSSVSSLVIQPYFYPTYLRADESSVNWMGFLRSFWIDPDYNFREDTVEAKVLNVAGSAIDKVFQMFFDRNYNETRAVMVKDPDSTCTDDGYKNINELIPVFNSACSLALRDLTANPRKIFVNRNGTLENFSETNTSLVNDLTTIWSGIDATVDSKVTQCVIRYLKGEDLSGDPTCSSIRYVQRSRELNIKPFCNLSTDTYATWRLGDIIHSTPAVVSNEPLATYHLKYNDNTYYDYISSTKYRSRSSILFVGANDGMLHAFRIGTVKELNNAETPVKLVNSQTSSGTDKIGIEEWAFIPKNAIPYLLWYGDPNYCHIYTVDYRLLLVDASVNGLPTDTKTASSWRTLLVGVMGFGGKRIIVNDANNNGICDSGETGCQVFSSSIFVFDLTDWLDGTASAPKLLWERNLPDETLTTSFPIVVKMRVGDPNAGVDESDKNGAWYVVVGSGPVDPEGNLFKDAKLYFYELEDNNGNGVYGELVHEIAIPGGTNMAVGDPMPVDVDRDYFDDVIYFGTYGLNGTVHTGGFFRLPLRNGSNYVTSLTSLSSLDVSAVVDLSEFKTGNHVPPVFAAPDFTKDEDGDFWVYFGTGRFLSNDDKELLYDNYFFGIKDECWDGGCNPPVTYSRNSLTDSTGINVTSTVTQLGEICQCDENGCGMVDVVVDTTFTEPNEVTVGWYINIGREAVISQPTIFGGIVDFLSYIPPQNICDFQGRSKLYALYYKTGTPYPRPSIISPEAVSYSGSDLTVGTSVQMNPSVELGPGVPPLGNPFEVAASKKRTYSKFIQISSGVVIEQKQQSVHEGGFLLWLEK